MRMIDADEVRANLTYEVCIPAVRAAMIALTCVAAAYKQPWVFVPMLLMFFVPWFLRRRALKEMTGAHPLVSAN